MPKDRRRNGGKIYQSGKATLRRVGHDARRPCSDCCSVVAGILLAAAGVYADRKAPAIFAIAHELPGVFKAIRVINADDIAIVFKVVGEAARAAGSKPM